MASLSDNAFGPTPLSVALRLAPTGFLADIQSRLQDAGVVEAVRGHEVGPVFDWAMQLLALQGVSDRAAIKFQREHGLITWANVQVGLQQPSCPRLRSWWDFQCGYRKTARACAEPAHIDACSLPQHDLRKGLLNEAAHAFALFLRDITGNDFVGWIDQRLASVDPTIESCDFSQKLGGAILDPLTEIAGTGPKVWSMI